MARLFRMELRLGRLIISAKTSQLILIALPWLRLGRLIISAKTWVEVTRATLSLRLGRLIISAKTCLRYPPDGAGFSHFATAENRPYRA